MKKTFIQHTLFILCAAMLAFSACDGTYTINVDSDSGKRFDSRLQGRWQTTRTDSAKSAYSCTLYIKRDTIEIYGYKGNLNEDVIEAEIPFRNFALERPLEGYSEKTSDINKSTFDGVLFCSSYGKWSQVEFIYEKNTKVTAVDVPSEFLLFTFGDKKIEFAKTKETTP